jgi:HD superfamily phosphodiesterase
MTEEQFRGLIEKARELLAQTKDPVHDEQHANRVWGNIRKIVEKLSEERKKDLDMMILKLAAMWHDIAFVYFNHDLVNYFLEGRRGARIAKAYFNKVGIDKDETDLVCDIIFHHQHSSLFLLNRKYSIYHQILQDADTMDVYNNPLRIKLAEVAAQGSSMWYKFMMRILKPLFFNKMRKSKLIYNLPESIQIVRGN